MGRLSFEDACRKYVHRYTMEHVPAWSQRRPVDDNCTDNSEDSFKYYAPHFRTDKEWYEHTLFPGDDGYPFPPRTRRFGAYTVGQTWPLGLRLDKPYTRQSK